MAQLLNRVQPGDIITAEMWNLAVDAVNELLEAGQANGIQIAALVPAGTSQAPIRIGTQLEITGRNFGYDIGQTRITFRGPFGDVVISRGSLLPGSADWRLLLMVPPIPGLPQGGASMTMEVHNGVAEDTRNVFVAPVTVSLQGDVFVNWRSDAQTNPNPNPLQVGQQADFFYQVQTGINMSAPFDLSVNIPSATVAIPSDLVSSIELRQDDVLIPNRRLHMGRNETRNVTVRIPQVPTALANHTFTLNLSASSGSIAGSDTRSFTVGQVVAPTDPNVTVQQTGAVLIDVSSNSIDSNLANGRLEGAIIRVREGKQLVLQFNARLTLMGDYNLTIQPRAGTSVTGWSLALVNTPPTITVQQDGDQSLHLVQFGVTATATASASGAVVFRIARSDAEFAWFTEFDLLRLT